MSSSTSLRARCVSDLRGICSSRMNLLYKGRDHAPGVQKIPLQDRETQTGSHNNTLGHSVMCRYDVGGHSARTLQGIPWTTERRTISASARPNQPRTTPTRASSACAASAPVARDTSARAAAKPRRRGRSIPARRLPGHHWSGQCRTPSPGRSGSRGEHHPGHQGRTPGAQAWSAGYGRWRVVRREHGYTRGYSPVRRVLLPHPPAARPQAVPSRSGAAGRDQSRKEPADQITTRCTNGQSC
jgi:hypothetical protein